METASSALSVLTAMITPAVLISASAALILSTSTRLGRVVDRVRELSDRFQELAHEQVRDTLAQKRFEIIFEQLDRLTSRARLLQRGITGFYLAVGIFVGTSVAIGIVSITGQRYGWIPVVLGLIGACFLFYGSVLLIMEARLALESTYKEMDFLWEMGKYYAPSELIERRKTGKRAFKILPRLR